MRRDYEAAGLVVIAFNHIQKSQEIRAYLDRHEFKLKVWVKDAQDGATEFGLKVGGSAVLIGSDGRVSWSSALFDPVGMRRAVEAATRAPK